MEDASRLIVLVGSERGESGGHTQTLELLVEAEDEYIAEGIRATSENMGVKPFNI